MAEDLNQIKNKLNLLKTELEEIKHKSISEKILDLDDLNSFKKDDIDREENIKLSIFKIKKKLKENLSEDLNIQKSNSKSILNKEKVEDFDSYEEKMKNKKSNTQKSNSNKSNLS